MLRQLIDSAEGPAMGTISRGIIDALGGLGETIQNKPESLLDPLYLSGGMDEQKLAKLESADPYTQMQWQRGLSENRHSADPLQDVTAPPGYVVRRNTEGGLELAVKPEGTDLGHGGGPVYNAAVDLGRFAQLGSGAGQLGGPGALAVQALGEAPSAGSALGMFAGTRARSAPLESFFKRDLLRKAGYTDSQAHQLTGISKPFDDQALRWEISDNKAALTPNVTEALAGDTKKAGKAPLPSILHHPELFEQYPELKDVVATIRRDPITPTYERQAGGVFNPYMNDSLGTIEVTGNRWEDILSTLLHETQHGIQTMEGWQNGADPDWLQRSAAGSGISGIDANKAYNYYAGAPGEIEARNTQTRKILTGPMRRALYPHITQDIVPGTEVQPLHGFWHSPEPLAQPMNQELVRALLGR